MDAALPCQGRFSFGRDHVRKPLKSRGRIAAAVTAVLALTAGLLVKRQLNAFDQRFREAQREINQVKSSVSSRVTSLRANEQYIR